MLSVKDKDNILDDKELESIVGLALQEDIGSGDITAELILAQQQNEAQIICKEDNVIVCGIHFVDAVYRKLNSDVMITWLVKDGDRIHNTQVIAHLKGSTRHLLTGERSALNFLQTLSGTATSTFSYVSRIPNSSTTKILDTRKTLPGLRLAQKYAVLCGNGCNHRMGLYDAFLIKENHIRACDNSITKAVLQAKTNHPNKFIEVEVTNLQELNEALNLPIQRIMLDNFSLKDIKKAVAVNQKRIPLEVSGNVSLEKITEIAETNVDYISVGSITKNIRAIDFSMLLCDSYSKFA